MKFIFSILIFVCFGFQIQAQSFHYLNNGAGPSSMANTSVAWTNEYAALNNQAGNLGVENWSFVASAQMLYGFSELSAFSGGFTKKLKKENGAISVALKYFGNENLNTQLLGLAYAKKIIKNWDLSIQADVAGYQVRGFGNRYVPTVEIGSMIQLSRKLNLGVHIFNPLSYRLNEFETIPSIFRIGLSYQSSDKVMLAAEITKELDEKFNIAAGISYEFHPAFVAKLGVATLSRQFSAGVGFRFGKASIDSSFGYRNSLGMTPGVAFSIKD